VVNDTDQTIVKGRGDLPVTALHRQDQGFVVERLGADASRANASCRDEAERGFGGGGGPRHGDS